MPSSMAPARGLGVASVVGPVGLLMVLLVGGCVAEGKCGARGCPGTFPCVCVSDACPPSQGSWFGCGACVLCEGYGVKCLPCAGS